MPIQTVHRLSALCAALTVGLLGFACATNPTPSPSPSPSPDPDDVDTNGVGRLAVFADPDSDFTTSDVYDVNGDIVQLDVDRDVLIWAETGAEFENWSVEDNDLLGNQRYRVRFGTEGGVPRAYFTEVGPATICDLQIGGLFGSLLIYATSTPVPNN